MDFDINSIPQTLLASLKEELQLNFEVSVVKVKLRENLEEIDKLTRSLSIKERLGFPSGDNKPDRLKQLKAKVGADQLAIRDRLARWRTLQNEVRPEVERILRSQSPGYIRFEQTGSIYFDLNQLLTSLEPNLKEYTSTLIDCRMLANAFISDSPQRVETANKLAQRVERLGEAIDEAIRHWQNLSLAHERLTEDTVLAETVIPALPQQDFGRFGSDMRHLPPAEIIARIQTFITRIQKISTAVIPTLKEELELAHQALLHQKRDFVNEAYESLRQETWCTMQLRLVEPEHTEYEHTSAEVVGFARAS